MKNKSTLEILEKVNKEIESIDFRFKLLNRLVILGAIITLVSLITFGIAKLYFLSVMILVLCFIFIISALKSQTKLLFRKRILLKKDFEVRIYGFK